MSKVLTSRGTGFHSQHALGTEMTQVKAELDALNGFESVTTAASNKALSPIIYESQLTTSGGGGTDNVSLAAPPASSGALFAGAAGGISNPIGSRKLITLKTLSHSGDNVAVAPGTLIKNDNVTAVTSLTFTAAGQLALFEWTGAKWRLIYNTATLV